MRRHVSVMGVAAVTVMLMGSLLVGLLLDPGRQPETWETALETYLDFRTSESQVEWQVFRSERATSPTRFGRDMSLVTYGTGTYFTTHVTYGGDEPRAESPTPTASGLSSVVLRRPLPYPPFEVWCALLTRNESGEMGDLLLYVVLHQDLYNAAWIVHEGGATPFGDEVIAGLAAIGCDGVADAALR